MPIQKETKLYPQLVVSPPGTEDDMFSWAQNMSKAYEDLSRNVIEKFNAHLDQEFAHPKSWVTFRRERPAFRVNRTGFTQVLVDASTSRPVYLRIRDGLYEITSQMVCNMNATGPGGRDASVSFAANTVYYLYAVLNSGVPALLATTAAPDVGPSGYSDWTYLGGFTTYYTGPPTISDFSSVGGVYMINGYQARYAALVGTPQSTPIKVPKFAGAAYGRMEVLSTGVANELVCAQSASVVDGNAPLMTRQYSASAEAPAHGWVRLETQQTIYLASAPTSSSIRGMFVLIGWREDPTDFQ